MSSRQTIITALEAQLKTGVTSVAGRVYGWRKSPLAITELPALLYQDGEATTAMEIIGIRTHSLSVSLLYCASTRSSPAQARNAADEVCAAIFADQTLGNSCSSIELNSHDINISLDDDMLGAAKIEITITYRTAPGAV